MTTNANSPDAAPDMPEVIVEYEAATPSLGGSDAAEFQIRRYSHATLECALYLALDARQAFEARCGALTDAQAQLLLARPGGRLVSRLHGLRRRAAGDRHAARP